MNDDENDSTGDYRDPELADSAAICADLLRSTAARWRARLAAGRLGNHPARETARLVAALDSAAATVEGHGEPILVPIATDADNRFRLLVDSVRDYAIFMLDVDGRIVSWNSGAERIYGHRAEEIVGSPFSRVYSEVDARSGQPARELAVAASEGRSESEGWRVRKDGSRFFATVTITAQRDDSGRLRGYAGVLRDTTAEREAAEELRQNEERFRLMVEAVQDYAIFMMSPEGCISSWNIGGERIKGYRPEEIIGKNFSVFYTEADRARHHPEEELADAAREGRYAEEGWRVRKDGSLFWASIVITALRDPSGRLIGFAKVTRDLTERKRQDELRDTIRARDEFLSVAAHELRTPVTALQLQLESLTELAASPSNGHRTLEHQLARAASSTARLARLIEALLDVSRIATGQFVLDVQPLDMRDVVRETIEHMRPAAERAGCELRLELPAEPARGRWDRVRVEEMIFNILTNAMKFGRGKPIEIRLIPSADTATIAIRDHGIGIADEDRERIFDRFERAVTSRHYGGLGLGLYITKQIATAHGGTVRAASAGEGTIFSIELPRERHDASTVEGESHEPRGA